MKTTIKKLYEPLFCFLSIISVIWAILDMNNKLTSVLSQVDCAIWIVFMMDYFIRLIIAKKKLTFVKYNIFDLIAILPFSSAFRVFRSLKLFKLLKLTKFSKTFRMIAVLGRFLIKLQVFSIQMDLNIC